MFKVPILLSNEVHSKRYFNAGLVTFPGKQLVLHCDALPNCEDDEALIYWLVNGSFPEETSCHDRIIETNESTLMEGSILQKSLLLKNVTLEDLKSTFSCVVTNAVGMTQKFIKLANTDCSDN
ncbi:hypothetical protein ATANTOWER_000828 [Ataeniobius toweri]|uniref:Ig-like domain-containing protein n=1 Tax=Ataeniobius toweri TaxID=208326 RepID=A0ABU7BSQ4_9TELE|nr:hypothetical protein [Ataeniobius toweri]